MLVIRFFRIGKINQPCFKIVVTDKRRSSTTGRFVEEVGFYNPVTKEKVLKADRIKYWISVGAQPSPTVFNLFLKEKIVEGKKIDVHKKAKKKEEAAASVAPVATVAAPVPAAAAAPAATPVPAPAAQPSEEVKTATPVAPAPRPAEAPGSIVEPVTEVKPAPAEETKPTPAPVVETSPDKEEEKKRN